MRNGVHVNALSSVGFTVLLAGTTACTFDAVDETPATTRQSTICGVVDWQNVEQYDGTLGPPASFVDNHERPVGNIKWRNDLAARYSNPGTTSGLRWCTGTLIRSDMMLTAGHCFDSQSSFPIDDSTGEPITPAQAATEMLVDFNYQFDPSGNARTVTTYSVTSLIEHRLGGVDYAIIQLGGSPGYAFGDTTISPFPLDVGDSVTVIQHPLGLPKKIHAGPVVGILSSLITYGSADTEPGSSGSGVLSDVTGYVHAVHAYGGCTPSGGANAGVRLSAIYPASAIVREVSFDAAKLVTALF